MRTFFRLVSLFLLIGTAWAQSQKVVSVPVIEDRQLYYAFFQYHQGLINVLQAGIAANPVSAAALNLQMAALLGVDVRELSVVTGITQQTTQSYASALAESKVNPGVAVAGPLTPTQVNAQYLLKRDRATVEAVRSLFQGLSSASWTGLHAYIVGAYKSTVYKPLIGDN